MSTPGYADITALTPAARTRAMLQAVVGQLCVAIVIARLVGLEVASRVGREA